MLYRISHIVIRCNNEALGQLLSLIHSLNALWDKRSNRLLTIFYPLARYIAPSLLYVKDLVDSATSLRTAAQRSPRDAMLVNRWFPRRVYRT